MIQQRPRSFAHLEHVVSRAIEISIDGEVICRDFFQTVYNLEDGILAMQVA